MRRKMFAGLWAAAIVMAMAPMTPAWAENPAVGSWCVHSQLNQTMTASDGSTVRCLADPNFGFIWQTDTGVEQSPPEAERIALEACKHQGRGRDECKSCANLRDGMADADAC